MNYIPTSTTSQHNKTPRSFLIAVALVHILTQTQLEPLQAAQTQTRIQQQVQDEPFSRLAWLWLTWWPPKCGLNNLGFEHEKKHEYQKAFQCYKGGTQEWGHHPIPMMHLARCYEHGIGTERDLKQAFAWYKKVADTYHWIEALERVAYYYDQGLGTEKDVEKATEYYEKALYEIANNFDRTLHTKLLFLDIQKLLVHRYIFGEGVTPDYDKAYDIGLIALDSW